MSQLRAPMGTIPDDVANAELRRLYECRAGARIALGAHRMRTTQLSFEAEQFATIVQDDALRLLGEPVTSGPREVTESAVRALGLHLRRLDDLVKDLAHERACVEELAQILGEGP